MISKQHRLRLPAMLSSKRALPSLLIVVVCSAPLFGQRPRMTYKAGQVQMLPKTPDDRLVVDNGDAKPPAGQKKTCSLQPFPGIPDTVSVRSLQIPQKAQKEYDEACSAMKNQQLPSAEKHLRTATKIYPQYVAGWVMLGQILETRQKTAEARNDCSRASTADPKYLPAYLCLAEIAGRQQQWLEVLNLTGRALELDAASDPYAYFFSAIAYFNLNHLAEAEKSALQSEAIEGNHHEPMLQYLLAQIYKAKHDSAEEVAHLRKYKDLVPDAQDAVRKDPAETANPK